jgi:hypothetical protein
MADCNRSPRSRRIAPIEEAEERYRLEPVECLTAEKLFDARWAMTLLAVALNRLRQEYANEGKTSTFGALKVFLDPVNSGALPSYEVSLSWMMHGQARMATL